VSNGGRRAGANRRGGTHSTNGGIHCKTYAREERKATLEKGGTDTRKKPSVGVKAEQILSVESCFKKE